MPANKKPRKAYRPRVSVYPDLHDVGLIFRPMHRILDQVEADQVDSVQGKPVFMDWQGRWCEVVPAINGWCDCFDRIAAGEGLTIKVEALRRMANRLEYCVPLTDGDVTAARAEVLAQQRVITKIPRKRIGGYMRTEQIAIEMDIAGLRNAA